ncbi:MAG: hypothetical protein U1E26_04775 [Coriobacteriia bacterium]|nr:hypothetical protein [Coriobacteriia bacterium]
MRTCRDCGTTWYLTHEEAREAAPDIASIQGARMHALGSGGVAGNHPARLEAQKWRVDPRNRCPQCESNDFDMKGPGLFGKYTGRPYHSLKLLEALENQAHTQQKFELMRLHMAQDSVGWADAKKEAERRLAAGAYDDSVPCAASPVSSAASTDTRTCPYCAEEVKSAAIKCKHCGSAIEPLA